MKSTVIFLLVLSALPLHAARETSEELEAVLERVVVFASKGEWKSMAQTYNAEAINLKSMQDTERFVTMLYKEHKAFGGADKVERLSSHYFGHSILRFRVLDKRAKGVILWTFAAVQIGDKWYADGFSITNNEDTLSLLPALDTGDITNLPDRPNQALVPTTMSVTPRADAQLAPDTVAADL